MLAAILDGMNDGGGNNGAGAGGVSRGAKIDWVPELTGPLRIGLGSDDDGSTIPVGRKPLCLIYCQPGA